MSSTVSIRVPRRVKELLQELNIDWYGKVKEYLEELIKEELRNRILNEADEIRSSIGAETSPAAKLIREDRENAR
ncbi:MAG: antitoxin [Candidatus Bathyarchaeia archaeon]|nr:antitoxin [Candidatus Bathyarchaeota archaeon]